MRSRATFQIFTAFAILGIAGGENATLTSGEDIKQGSPAIKSASLAPTPKQRLDLLLPRVNFEEADLEQVLGFLSQKAGVNIIIDPVVYTIPATVSPGSSPAAPDVSSPPSGAPPTQGYVPPQRGVPSPALGKITLRLKNVPLKAVLKYALRYKNLRYIVDDYAIVIVPVGWVPREELTTRVFRLRAGGLSAPRFSRQQAAPSL